MIFVVNGAPGAGKTTFENYVKKIIGDNSCNILSTVDVVKRIASLCGWDGSKTPRNRKFLSDLKDLLTEWNDVPFKDIQARIQDITEEYGYYGADIKNTHIFFVDCREPEEIKKLCERLGAKSILVTNHNKQLEATSNHADANVLNYNYDIIINNDGTLADLCDAAFQFLDEVHFDDKLNPWRKKNIQFALDGTPVF